MPAMPRAESAKLALTVLLTIAATCVFARTSIAALPARVMYSMALEREQGVRADLARASAADPSREVLTAVRRVVAAYEAIVRRYPTSGYSDNALWQAGRLSLDAYAIFNDTLDRDAGVRLLQRLTQAYPSSRLVKQVPEQLAKVDAVQTGDATGAGRGGVVGETTGATAGRPVTAVAGEGAHGPIDQRLGKIAVIKDIRRSVLPDAVRVTIEVDQEVLFHEERIAGPDRVFLDLPSTRATAALADQTLRFPGDGDVVSQIRVGRHSASVTRVVLDTTGVATYSVYPLYNPYRLVIDCVRPQGSKLTVAGPLDSHRVVSSSQRLALRVVPQHGVLLADAHRALDEPPVVPSRPVRVTEALPLPRGSSPAGVPSDESSEQVVATAGVVPGGTAMATAVAPSAVPPSAVAPTAVAGSAKTAPKGAPGGALPSRNSTGGFSMARQLGLSVSRIVIDPGHGGHDPGAQARGVSEAELVLDVSLRLEKLLQKTPGVEVILTRRSDEFVPLQERTAIANREGADLFLSIHANASASPQAHGVETYFLNFANNLSAAAVAARENAASGQAMGVLPDFVKAIALNNKLDESRDLATAVQRSMIEQLRPANRTLKDLGVKQAPFVVLIGAAMPSVLAEISFVTNPQEARLLKSGGYRQRIAEALNDALRKYRLSLANATTAGVQH